MCGVREGGGGGEHNVYMCQTFRGLGGGGGQLASKATSYHITHSDLVLVTHTEVLFELISHLTIYT